MCSDADTCLHYNEGVCTDCIRCNWQTDMYEAKDKRKTIFEDDEKMCNNCIHKDEGVCTDCTHCPEWRTDLYEERN